MREADVTLMLEAAARGDQAAADRLLPLVYGELRKLAGSRMARLAPGQTLQPTALVNEAYLRLVGRADVRWENRGHFFFAAARAMRDILVEQARRKGRVKRGAGWKRVDDRNISVAIETPADDMLALAASLEALERESPRQHELVLLRFFVGLTMEEAARAMGTSLRTAERDWRLARAKLRHLLSVPPADEPERDDHP